MVYNCIEFILATLYPARCRLCAGATSPPLTLCHGCLETLPYNSHCCLCCGLPLPKETGEQAVCGHCRSQPPAYDRTIIPLLYQPPVSHMISAFKFHNQLHYGPLFAQLLADRLAQEPEIPDCLIPVPLHPSRLRQRGYNQALELTLTLSRLLSIRHDRHCCIRERPTTPQLGQTRAQRRRNIRQAFGMQQPIDAQHVAIIDDVVTTGSTVNEMAKTLKLAGVERVDVWAIARTP